MSEPEIKFERSELDPYEKLREARARFEAALMEFRAQSELLKILATTRGSDGRPGRERADALTTWPRRVDREN
jgi:hypothetical protein